MKNKLPRRYAAALLEYAKELEQVRPLRQNADAVLTGTGEPCEKLRLFLEATPKRDQTLVLRHFIIMADEYLAVLNCEVITAVALSPAQLEAMAEKLTAYFRKCAVVYNTIDPLILGGVVVVAGHVVIDDSIRRKLRDMKHEIYCEVFTA